MLRSLLLLLTFTVSFYAQAQNIDTQTLDKYFDILAENDAFMGSVVVQKDSTILFQKAVGQRDEDNGMENTPQTVFRLGSISKMFTSTMIFQLIEEGKLTLDTKLDEFFPLLQHSDKISIGQMLRHQSGLFDFTSDRKYGNYMFTEKNRKDLLTIIRMGDPAFVPGTQTAYSNTNFVLLSFIIEDLDENTFEKSLNTRITDTLQTKTIAYGNTINTSNNEALSYMYNGTFWQDAGQTHMSIPMGAGAIVGNAADINTFTNALLNSEKLISKASQDIMVETVGDRYGYGIFQLPFDGLSAYGHGGSIDGFRTRTAFIKDSGISVTLLCNGLNYDISEIADAVIKAVSGKDFEFPLFEDVSLSKNQLDRYHGNFESSAIPLKIEITITDDNKVSVQATGQQAFALNTDSETEFSLKALGLKITFDELDNGIYKAFILNQGGAVIKFDRISSKE